MSHKVLHLDQVFVARQRERLIELRDGLLNTTRVEVAEETDIHRQSAGEAREYEDDAQKLAQLEIDGALVGLSLQRLPAIERALRKIDAGTYGLSDVSGKPIPRERLEVMPDAICAVAEEEAHTAVYRR